MLSQTEQWELLRFRYQTLLQWLEDDGKVSQAEMIPLVIEVVKKGIEADRENGGMDIVIGYAFLQAQGFNDRNQQEIIFWLQQQSQFRVPDGHHARRMKDEYERIFIHIQTFWEILPEDDNLLDPRKTRPLAQPAQASRNGPMDWSMLMLAAGVVLGSILYPSGGDVRLLVFMAIAWLFGLVPFTREHVLMKSQREPLSIRAVISIGTSVVILLMAAYGVALQLWMVTIGFGFGLVLIAVLWIYRRWHRVG